ncbi:asparaginase domain-containing protein [Arhodomonas sp. SL1]|uniref:asparaginase domain-containing protein n=1 Tax=Arhodomonas sp. SL1 TaxID=3425691 RepID=UPI003F883A3C
MSEAGEAVVVITTGGTFDKVYFDAASAYRVGDPQAVPILEQARVGLPWRVIPLLAKDSLEMTDADRECIREAIAATPERRVVITHGTDTLVNTARFLGDGGGRTVCLVGAMQPARMRETDASFNLGFALAAVQLLPPGVHITMNGRVLAPETARKNRSAGRFDVGPRGD